MERISEGIFFIKGQDEFIPDSHVYILGKPESGDLTMVDAGLSGKSNYKISAMRSLGIDPRDISRVIMTHTHFDHIGCLKDMMRFFPKAELWVHKAEGEALEQGDDITVYGMEMFRAMCMSQYGISAGAFKLKVDRKLEDGEKLTLAGTLWEVIHVPGHSAGSIALYNRDLKALIAGDVIYADHAIGRFDLHGADALLHKDSLYKLSKLEVTMLFPGHNRILKKVTPGYILETAKQWEPYLS